MFIVNPLHTRKSDSLFSTHPNMDNRINALKKMATTLPQKRHRSSRIPSTTPPKVKGPWG